MPVRFVKITYAGQDCIVPDARLAADLKARGVDVDRLNTFTTRVTASAWGEGFFLMTAAAVKIIIRTVLMVDDPMDPAFDAMSVLRFDSTSKIGTSGSMFSREKVDLFNITVGPKTRALDADLFLLHLVDQRYTANRNYRSSDRYYNITFPTPTNPPLPAQPQALSYSESMNGASEWTWSELINDLWSALLAMGFDSPTATLTLPAEDPTISPRDFVFNYTALTNAIDSVLRANAWVLVFNPFDNTARIEDLLEGPLTSIEHALAPFRRRHLDGGLTHPKYNYENHDWATDNPTEGPTKFFGSDLYALPFNTRALHPGKVRVAFPKRFLQGRYPSDRGTSVATHQWHAVEPSYTDPELETIDPDFKEGILQRADPNATMTYYDIQPAIVNNIIPELVANGTILNSRAKYLGLRMHASQLVPRGRVSYDGFHPIRPSIHIHTITWGIRDGHGFTEVDLEGGRPRMMFGSEFEDLPAGIAVTGLGLVQVQARPDGGFAINAHAPLMSWWNEPDPGDLCP